MPRNTNTNTDAAPVSFPNVIRWDGILDAKAARDCNAWVGLFGCTKCKRSASIQHPKTRTALVTMGNGDGYFLSACGACNTRRVFPFSGVEHYAVAGASPDGVVTDVPVTEHHGWHMRRDDGSYGRRTAQAGA